MMSSGEYAAPAPWQASHWTPGSLSLDAGPPPVAWQATQRASLAGTPGVGVPCGPAAQARASAS